MPDERFCSREGAAAPPFCRDGSTFCSRFYGWMVPFTGVNAGAAGRNSGGCPSARDGALMFATMPALFAIDWA